MDDKPRAAATLVVLCDGRDGVEVLLTVRPRSLRFMGGATVFPGGAVDAADHDARWAEVCTPPHDAERVCALREAFEEVGLLLADGPSIPRSSSREGASFLEACLRAGVRLRADRLVPGGRWVTPSGSPVRFDAAFFLAEAPPGWVPDPDPGEVESVRWATPAQALAELASGEALMAPPTIEMLQRLDGLPSVAAALDAVTEAPVGTPGILSTRVSPLVHVVLAPNPGLLTGPGTNTYVVGSGPAIVVDPAVDDEAYVGEVARVAGEVAAIVVTHRHSDHTGGVTAVRAALGASIPVRAWGPEPIDGVGPRPLEDGEVLTAGGTELRTVFTPGHASDHVCLYAERTATLFSGDTILGEGTAVIAPPDGDMGDYLDSLERLRELHVERIFPGHFRALNGGRDVIDGYIAHRRARERKIVEALSGGAATVEEIVRHAYDDTPAELHPAAAMSALAHLELLERDGRAGSEDHRWRLTGVD